MCGRFTLTVSADDLKDAVGLEIVPSEYQPRYNIAPTQPVAVVRSFPPKELEMMRWGLVPSCAKDPSIGNRLINARAETLTEKPAFRSAFAKRRCLILMDGFFEWKRGEGKGARSQPYWFTPGDGKVAAFAGLYELWFHKEDEPLVSCTIITTEANDVVRPVHDRMPVILPRERWSDWLEGSSPDQLLALLRPANLSLEAVPVSPAVNSPAVDRPELIQPIAGL